jgi:hypothetical protein
MRTKNTSRQIKAMLYKNLLLKKRQKAGLVVDFLFPVLIGYIFWSAGNAFKCPDCNDDQKNAMRAQAALTLPLLLAIYVPLMVLIGG